MRQETAFWAGEGDAWFRRNPSTNLNPVVISTIAALDIKPKRILEIGCGTGKYLNALWMLYGCTCIGVDPSGEAIAFGKEQYPDLKLYLGTAESTCTLFRGEDDFDLIIYGFCLYVVSREELFCVTAFTDTLLKQGGHLAIHDFHPALPQKVPYHHQAGLFSYKMRYADLWLANPAYEWVSEDPTADGEAITIIRKGSWDRWA